MTAGAPSGGGAVAAPYEPARCFRWACGLDVAVRKAGNVSLASPGHGMSAALFIDSARAASVALCEPGAPVGRRIEGAVRATLQVAQCNTNLGILLLCAPVLVAAEGIAESGLCAPTALQRAIEAVLGALDVADAQQAFRGIAAASPGGLGAAEQADVHEVPRIGLRAAMALAAGRDQIARAYTQGFTSLFEQLLPSFCGAPVAAWSPRVGLLRCYLKALASDSDSHIVRKHGEALAHSVMNEAAPWSARVDSGEDIESDPGYIAWDTSLKQRAINPGTSADLAVTTALLASLCHAPSRRHAHEARD